MLAPLAVAVALPPAAQGAAHFTSCPGRPGVECARVQVPLDRSAPGASSVGLHVERWVARPSRGVLVLLAGGPGQASTRVFDVAGVFAGMFVLSAFVILIDFAVTLVERRLLVWRPVAANGRS